MKALSFIIPALFCIPLSAHAKPYAVDYNASNMSFSGTHVDKTFTGRFTKWAADIDFDAAHPERSTVSVTIDTDSARTNNALYDGTLPTTDWFNTSEYPTAIFTTHTITKKSDGIYTAQGDLDIRSHKEPVTFDFTLESKKGDKDAVKVDFTLSVDRLKFAIGKESDPDAKWVSKEITIDVSLRAVDAGMLASRLAYTNRIAY